MISILFSACESPVSAKFVSGLGSPILTCR